MTELAFKGGEPEGSAVTVDLQAVFFHGEKAVTVKGFYAGEGVYKVRFLPEETGTYPYCVTGSVLDGPMEGALEVMPAEEGRHGIVRANGTHL
ncbi:DUF5060 domain-containing protein [Schaedlerella arabinosiphila]|jgi:hypothetical protein|uniref:DUF5060 domain-containing protein n=1 Tax=Schaedlerella arabinosiphila TaxID=2044587 RepID=A0A9X5CCF4_9FIRM|nr:hypothetical protein C824_005438 [Schaedlerella arabinosiphila]NDO70212.1 DUF5060 domain-containing protein [Schaedlerella arabinosiphila]